jgi:hypothetical protein
VEGLVGYARDEFKSFLQREEAKLEVFFVVYFAQMYLVQQPCGIFTMPMLVNCIAQGQGVRRWGGLTKCTRGDDVLWVTDESLQEINTKKKKKDPQCIPLTVPASTPPVQVDKYDLIVTASHCCNAFHFSPTLLLIIT